MTKAHRIKRLRKMLAIGRDAGSEFRTNMLARVLLDYFHAVNEEAIENMTKTGMIAGSHLAAMKNVMRQIGIKVKI